MLWTSFTFPAVEIDLRELNERHVARSPPRIGQILLRRVSRDGARPQDESEPARPDDGRFQGTGSNDWTITAPHDHVIQTRSSQPSATFLFWGERCRLGGRISERDLSPLLTPDALHNVGKELAAALDTETAIEGGHVLMSGGVAEAEARRDLLLAVALQ